MVEKKPQTTEDVDLIGYNVVTSTKDVLMGESDLGHCAYPKHNLTWDKSSGRRNLEDELVDK